MISAGRAVGISSPPPLVAAVGIEPPAAAGASAPGPWASEVAPPPRQQNPSEGGGNSRSRVRLKNRSSSSSSSAINDDDGGDDSNSGPPAPAIERGTSSRLSLRLRKFNNPAQPTRAPTLKTEECSSSGSTTDGISSRGKTCTHEEEGASTCTRRPCFGFPGTLPGLLSPKLSSELLSICFRVLAMLWRFKQHKQLRNQVAKKPVKCFPYRLRFKTNCCEGAAG